MAHLLFLLLIMKEVLEKIKDFADQAHGDQKRKYTQDRYIVHPERVMHMCQQYDSSLPVSAAALLHDVLEDTPVTQRELHQFLLSVMNDTDAQQTTHLVEELTDVYTKQKYPRLNRRTRNQKEANRIERTSPESQTIKYADIIDNCKEIAIHDPEFAGLFLCECRMLLRRMQKGNKELYGKAVETVDNCLKQVPREFRTIK
jgi:guanosine-3',5'-bis(diphosphate) 3'-pyrophosphohydrolase